MDKLLATHVFTLNPQLMLATKVFSNGDPGEEGVFLNQELTLNSYGNSASFNLCGAILSPEILRKLANELEVVMVRAGAENKGE